MLPVPLQSGDTGVVIGNDADVVAGGVGFSQALDALQHLMDVGVRKCQRVFRADQAVYQVVQAIRLIDDHLRVVMQLAVSDFAGQQLRCAADATQRILDLMGQSPHQLLSGGPCAAQNFLLIDALCMFQRIQLDQGRNFAAGFVGIDGVVHQN